MMIRRTSSISFILSLALIFTSCGVLNQTREMKNFSKCSFRLRDVREIELAGVNVEHVEQFSDLSFSETAQITSSLLTGKLPLTFTLNIEIQNPNQEKASMSELIWILYIDNAEITDGILEKRIEISPGGISVVPVNLNLDLLKILSGKSSQAAMNFGLNLSGQGGSPSRMKLKVKPSIYVSGKKISYPGYISIEDEFVFE